MCAFCRKGWRERYPSKSTLGGKASMELSTQWDAGRDVLVFNVYGSGGGSVLFKVNYCPMCGEELIRGDAE